MEKIKKDVLTNIIIRERERFALADAGLIDKLIWI